MTKAEMRSHYLALRKNQPKEDLLLSGEKIREKILTRPELAECKTVMIYISFGAEVDTHVLAEELIAQGKYVCAPLCNAENGTMMPYFFDGISSLHKGTYGILEPKPERPVEISQIDCIFVPGCVFGHNFHRIGYGKGYYDRFLRQANHALKIGLCYSFCLAEQVEAEWTDVPVDMIVTENEVLKK